MEIVVITAERAILIAIRVSIKEVPDHINSPVGKVPANAQDQRKSLKSSYHICCMYRL